MVVVEGTVNRIFKLFSSLIFVGLLFCNESSLSDDDIIELFHSIQELEYKDSLKTALIAELEYEILEHDLWHKQDSMLLSLQNQEITALNKSIQLHKDLYETTRPRWYDSKVVWFINGFAAVLVSSYVVKNVK